MTYDLSPSQKRQLDREKSQRDYFLGKRKQQTQERYSRKQGSQTEGARGLRFVLVPKIAEWIEKRTEAVTSNANGKVGFAVAEFLRIRSYVDAETMAHICLSVILDNIGSGATMKCSVTLVNRLIAEQIEHQAFIAYMEEVDPGYFLKLQKWYLNDPVRTYDRKIKAMVHAHNKHEEMDFKRMDQEQLIRFGSLLLQAVMSIRVDQESGEGLFEARKPLWNDPNKPSKRNKKHTDQLYLGYSKAGLKYRDMLQAMADEDAMRPTPMVCEPLDWSLTERGGYLTHINRKAGDLIHNNNGSIPSQIVLDAINRLQKVPFRINTYILDLQEQLLKSTWEIGSFRSFERDSWKDEHFPVVDSNWLATLDTDSAEYKETMKTITVAYHNHNIDETKAEPPRRTWLQAKELEN